LDTDNDSVFMNETVRDYCQQVGIEFIVKKARDPIGAEPGLPRTSQRKSPPNQAVISEPVLTRSTPLGKVAEGVAMGVAGVRIIWIAISLSLGSI
jgi:hypothetical protein